MNFFGGDPVLTAGRSAFIVFMLILFASLYVWPWFRSSTFLGIVYGVAFATSGLLWAGYFKDIARFARSASGEFAELALMPGLGSGRTLRFALYRAVLGTPLRWLAAILVAGTIILLLEGGSLSSVRTLILMMVIIALAYSDHALLMLTSRRLRNAFRSGVVAFATVGTFLPVTFVGNEAWRWSWLHELMMGVVLAALALGIYIPVRKLAAAPHPFIG